MKSHILIFALSLFFISFTACTIEGEALCGVWYAGGDYGQMKIEITPWQGKFHGYLLEYKDDTSHIQGAKEDEYIFLTDLVFENNQYQNGKIYIDPNSEESCNISLAFLDNNRLKASYNCNGEKFEEIWSRDGSNQDIEGKEDKSNVRVANSIQTENQKTDAENVTTASTSVNTVSTSTANIEKEKVKSKSVTPSSIDAPQNTQNQGIFYVIGIREEVAYDDNKRVAKVVENLWTKIYNDDFSNKLDNIVEPEKMYAIYSNYDQPKGKMTITIGYKVKDLSSVSADLTGMKILANEYYVYPLSGETSDYEGEGWDQLEELAAYRKAESVDFEVYEFDSNYEIANAELWVAAK